METHRWRHRDFYVQKRAFRKRIAPAVDARTSWTRRLYRPETRSMWSSNHCSAVRRNAIASPCALCRRAVSACCIGSLGISIDSSTLRSESRRALSLATVTVPLLEPEQPRDEGARRYVRREVGLGVGLQPTRLDRRASIFGLVFWVQHGLYERMFLELLKRLDGLLSVVLRILRLVVSEKFPEAALEVLGSPTGKRRDRLADAGAHE